MSELWWERDNSDVRKGESYKGKGEGIVKVSGKNSHCK